ncbi:MAG: hypothetical protein KatS3mg108_1885 [Isosphaeraceae bacterium]|jgi:hypothetical protein|nr:MAG: hypothetical protein KatS3mg108_1885 [Isosphaeraceae bacterium]
MGQGSVLVQRWGRLAVLAIALVGGRSAWCDVYEFVAGGRTEGGPVVDGQPIELQSPWKIYRFVADDFRRIEPAPWPPAEWPERREAARAGTSDDRHAAALWALDHGLVDEAAAMWREAHRLDPNHRFIERMVRVLEGLAEERPDPELSQFDGLIPQGYQIERGPHVLVWHRHRSVDAKARVALLERVFTAFYLDAARHGLILEIPAARLPSIWFAERSDYLGYLEREGAAGFENTRGYHHPIRGLAASYDARSDDDQRRARRAIAARRSELAAFRKRITQAPQQARIRLGPQGTPGKSSTAADAIGELDRLERDLDRQELLLDLTWQALDEGNAAHELIHQLVSRSSLAPRHAAFPIWLHEGLAMQFEAFRGGLWAGAGTPVAIRLRDFRAIRPAPPLAPLLRDAGLSAGYRDDSYAQAWAWVFYLRQNRPDAWLILLDTLRRPVLDPRPVTTRSREALEPLWEGGLQTAERSWHTTLEALTAPEPAGPFRRRN